VQRHRGLAVDAILDFMKHLGSGTVFFVLMPGTVFVSALVIWRLAELCGEHLINIGEFVVVVLILLTVVIYMVSNWQEITPYILAAGYLVAFMIYVQLRQGEERRVRIDYKQMQASLEEVKQAQTERARKERRRTTHQRATPSAEESETAEERIAVCPFCQRESLIVQGKCMGCGQMLPKEPEHRD